jgi:septin 3/9/12
MATMDRHAPQQSVYPRSHVGFDSITSQIERKLLKRGFQFNVICVVKLSFSSFILSPLASAQC